MSELKLFDVVALTEDIPEYKLRRGQVGTVVEVFQDGKAYEVDFSDMSGRTYQSIGIEPEKLMVLLNEPELAVA